MVSVAIGVEGNNLGIDVCIACQCELSFLQHHYTCSLCHDKAISTLVIWARCPFGVLIACTRSSQDTEYVYNHVRNGRVGSTCEHAIGSSLLNSPESLSNGICSGRAAGGDDSTWPVKLMVYSYCGGRRVRHAQTGRNDLAHHITQW